jgi:hypothetical protein
MARHFGRLPRRQRLEFGLDDGLQVSSRTRGTMKQPAPDNPTTATPASPPTHRHACAAWAERAFVAATCLAIAFIWYHYLNNYWGRWGSINVDFGRELYIPWQITQGKVLYRDVAHINGPLSPYFNAALFSVFGVSLNTIEIANLVISLIVASLIWKIVSFLTNHCVAGVTVIVFFLISVFSHDYGNGIYCFISPYSHEITHGMLLGLLGLVLVSRYARRPSRTNAFLLGCVAGLGLLTKPEIALAIVASTGAGFALVALRREQRIREGLLRAALLALGLVLPFGLALLCLSLSQPMADAFSGMTRMWRMTLNPAITESFFYKNVLGTRNLPQNIHNIGRSLILNTILLAYIVITAQAGRILPRFNGFFASVLIIVTSFYCISIFSKQDQIMTTFFWAAALPLLVLGFLFFLLFKFIHHRSFLQNKKFVFLCSLTVFALCSSLKIFLNAQQFHYGKFLLIPSIMLYCMTILYIIPISFENKPAIKNSVFCCGLIALYFILYFRVEMSNRQLALKTYAITSSHGTLYCDKEESIVQNLLKILNNAAEQGHTLAVVPEGAMLNFLSGMPSSTRYIKLMPPEWEAFGEENILASYAAHPPDFVCLPINSLRSYNIDSFENNYGAQLMQFIKSYYTEIASAHKGQFYYQLYRHNDHK